MSHIVTVRPFFSFDIHYRRVCVNYHPALGLSMGPVSLPASCTAGSFSITCLFSSISYVGMTARTIDFSAPIPSGLSAGQVIFPDDTAAADYLLVGCLRELHVRVSKARSRSFGYRFDAVRRLFHHVSNSSDIQGLQTAWNSRASRELQELSWSPDQQRALDAIASGLQVSDANTSSYANRFLHLKGMPGTGKTEVILHAAYRAAHSGARVLILCPTGILVHAYRDRLGDLVGVTVETIHSSFQIGRQADQLVRYAPPTRLRRYDLIFIDEGSQIDDYLFSRLFLGFRELPQRPFVVFAADYQQLNPIGSSLLSRAFAAALFIIELVTVHRTKDPALLDFCLLIPERQPSKAILADFFSGRILSGGLRSAVSFALNLQRSRESMFTWLCVTNRGASKVNECAISLLGIHAGLLASGMFGDAKVAKGRIYVAPGVVVRLTRNLDKDRGFVNGAIGVVVDVLHQEVSRSVFSVRLSNGTLLLVHPICDEGRVFLPCVYGYATTIRRAQGSSLALGLTRVPWQR